MKAALRSLEHAASMLATAEPEERQKLIEHVNGLNALVTYQQIIAENVLK